VAKLIKAGEIGGLSLRARRPSCANEGFPS
jgi:hypothetical protein